MCAVAMVERWGYEPLGCEWCGCEPLKMMCCELLVCERWSYEPLEMIVCERWSYEPLGMFVCERWSYDPLEMFARERWGHEPHKMVCVFASCAVGEWDGQIVPPPHSLACFFSGLCFSCLPSFA